LEYNLKVEAEVAHKEVNMEMPHIVSNVPYLLCACDACEKNHAQKAEATSVQEAITQLVAIERRYNTYRLLETDSMQRTYLHIYLRTHGYVQFWDEDENMVACPIDNRVKEYYIYPNLRRAHL
jgi:hypothetical protein